jgi:hypothetical protein
MQIYIFNCHGPFQIHSWALKIYKYIIPTQLITVKKSRIPKKNLRKKIYHKKSKHLSNLYSKTKRFKERKHFYIPKMLSKYNGYLGT